MANITGKDLVKKILQGERNFNQIILIGDKDLKEHIPELNEYLKKENLIENPILLNNSNINHIIVPEIYLPFTRLNEANMEGANMEGANMYRANMSLANMERANMSWANINGADMSFVNMCGADMREVKGLSMTYNLEYAIFGNTIVTKREKGIIKKARKRLNPFVVKN